MRWLLMAALWGLAIVESLAEKRPEILVVASCIDPEARQTLEAKFSGRITFDPSCGPQLTSAVLHSRLKGLSEGGLVKTDGVLISAAPDDRPVPTQMGDLKEAVALARGLGSQVLGINKSSAEKVEANVEFDRACEAVFREEGVVLVDMAGAAKVALRPGWTWGRAQAEYLIEGLGQWWWVCCPANPHLRRGRLWTGTPPAFQKTSGERINKVGRVDGICQPEIARYLCESPSSGTAVIYFSGGGYGQIGFLRNVDGLGEKLCPQGIALFALKYRTGRGGDVPIHDAQRAVRWVRCHAAELGIDPRRIGVAGISAGANLVLQLISQFTPGNPDAEDPLDRVSSRPDFAVVLTSWNHGSQDSPFRFPADAPPVFLRHAKDDAAFPLVQTIVGQLQEAKVPVEFLYLDKGGHGAFDQGPDSLGKAWPSAFVPWLRQNGLYEPPRAAP